MARRRTSRNKQIIFLSHAHEDAAQARAIKNWLEKNLINVAEVFVSSDDSSNPPGADWSRNVRTHLERADLALCLLSPNSLESRWVHYEAGAACMRKRPGGGNIPVIPICLGGVRKEDLPVPLNIRNAITLPDDEARLLDLVVEEMDLELTTRVPLDLPEFEHTGTAAWLFSEAQLIKYERTFRGQEIWVISANMDHDMIDKAFADAVAWNLEHGVTYVYVLPDKQELLPVIEGIQNAYGTSKQPPIFQLVKPELFDNITETNITVYNPVSAPNASTEVFIELPTDMEPTRRHWAKVHPYFARKYVNKVRTLEKRIVMTKAPGVDIS